MTANKLSGFHFIAFFILLSCSNHKQNIINNTANIKPYEQVKGWPDLPDNYISGNPTGIGIDSNQNVFIFQRAGRTWPLFRSMPVTHIASKTIFLFDNKTGKILNSWGDNMFVMPHGLTVDLNNNVWVTDVGLNQVFKFDHDGKLLMTLGEASVPGNDSNHFNRPTDVAVEKNGSFYVSDGYGNSRIVKFSSTGKYLLEWGTKGNDDAQFNIPHAITLDDKKNIYVADRENNRIQIFDTSGKYIKQWTNKSFGKINSLTFDKGTKKFIVVDEDVSWFGLKHNGSDAIILDSMGNILNRFGRTGLFEGPKCWYHDLAIDNEENIYVGDILGNRIQKFKKIQK